MLGLIFRLLARILSGYNFAALRVWRDFDQDGVADAGELASLANAGIASLGLAATPMDQDTPQGNHLLAHGTFTRANGTTGTMFDMAFDTNATDTVYRGDKGTAQWLAAAPLPNVKGREATGEARQKGPVDLFELRAHRARARGREGSMTDLRVAASNDFGLAATLKTAAAAMSVPTLDAIRAAATPIFGEWAQSLELTRELTPVLLATSPTGVTLADRAIWHEDANGGWWTLNSGAPVLNAQGVAIARPTLEQVLSQGEIFTVSNDNQFALRRAS
jgi:hypothetical protein